VLFLSARILLLSALALLFSLVPASARASWFYGDHWTFDNQAAAAQACEESLAQHMTPDGWYQPHLQQGCTFQVNGLEPVYFFDSDGSPGYFYLITYTDIYEHTIVGALHWNGPTCYPPNIPQEDGSCVEPPPEPPVCIPPDVLLPDNTCGPPPTCVLPDVLLPDNTCGRPPVCLLPQVLLPDFTCGLPPGDANNGSPKCGVGAGNPINCATGNKYQHESDVVISDLLRFERSYNSGADSPSNLLGPHWVNTYYRRVDVMDASHVIVRREDGAGFRYTLSGSAWVAPSGIFSTLTRMTDGGGNLIGWTFKQQDSREVENFDARGRLTSIVRNDGQSVALVYNYGLIESGPNDYVPTSITAQDGRTLSLLFDAQQRLIKLTDPLGSEITYAYDLAGRLQTVAYPGGASKTYLYNEAAYTGGANLLVALTGIVDEKSQRFATFSYQADGRAVSTEHAGGVQKYTVSYNDALGSSSVTKPSSLVQQRGFDRATSVFRVSSTTETGNGQTRSTSQTFDANGNPDIATDAKGTTTDSDYNARGLETQRIESANVAATKRTIQTDWDPNLNVPAERRVLNSAGTLEAKAVWTYNTRGQVLTASLIHLTNSAQTRTTTYSYCEQAGVNANTCPIVGLLLSVDGPLTLVSDVTTYTYRQANDPACTSNPPACRWRKGDLWKTTNALGQVSEVLDSVGRILSANDANGVATDLEFNDRGWLTARKVRGIDNATEADDAITRIEYDSTGMVTKLTQPDGDFVGFTYDAAHRLTDVTDALGNSIHYTLDNDGQRIQEDTKNSASVVKRTLSRVYDTLGQLKTQADAYATPTDFTYDLSGALDTSTDPLLRVTDRDVDALGRLAQVIANVSGGTSDRATSQFQYDARDNLRVVIDPKGLSTAYTYDSLNNLTQLVSPDTGSTTYGYDLAGNRTSETRADNVAQGYTYDLLGRLTGQTFAHSPQNLAYTYDTTQSDCAVGETYSAGRLTKETYKGGSTRYCYDIRGNRVRQAQTLATGSSLTVGTTYTAGGRLQAMTYPSGAIVTYLRNANGQITRIDAKPTATDPQIVLVSSVTYLPFGPLQAMTFGNGRILTKNYDLNYGIDSVSDSAASNPLFEDFTLNAVGNIVGLTERTGASSTTTRTFGYDGLGRLQLHLNGTTTFEAYTYDATGNRLGKTLTGTTAYTYSPNSHQLTAVGSEARTYFPGGETKQIGTASSGTTFTYNDQHRMDTSKTGFVNSTSYSYNGRGERILKQAGLVGNVTQYVYDESGHLLGEYNGNGVRSKEYVWLDDTLVAVLGAFDGSNYHLVETDHLGTPRAVVHPIKKSDRVALGSEHARVRRPAAKR